MNCTVVRLITSNGFCAEVREPGDARSDDGIICVFLRPCHDKDGEVKQARKSGTTFFVDI